MPVCTQCFLNYLKLYEAHDHEALLINGQSYFKRLPALNRIDYTPQGNFLVGIHLISLFQSSAPPRFLQSVCSEGRRGDSQSRH